MTDSHVCQHALMQDEILVTEMCVCVINIQAVLFFFRKTDSRAQKIRIYTIVDLGFAHHWLAVVCLGDRHCRKSIWRLSLCCVV